MFQQTLQKSLTLFIYYFCVFSVLMSVINHIEMTKAAHCASAHAESPSCFSFHFFLLFFFFSPVCWSLAQTSCWVQMESVGGDRSCQISNFKPRVCLVWIRDEHNMDESVDKRLNREEENSGPSNSTSLQMEGMNRRSCATIQTAAATWIFEIPMCHTRPQK